MPDALLAAAAAVTVERLGVGERDTLLVVHDGQLAQLAEAVAQAGRARTERVRALPFAGTTRDGEEPPPEIAAAMLEATAIALVTTFSLSHTRARVAATDAGARVASMPGINADMFRRTLPVDYARMESIGRSLAAQLSEADRCRITGPGGTEVEISLRGRTGRSDDGDLRAPGSFGNLPAGEAYIAPVEHAGTGTIVFDASIATLGLLSEPLSLEVANGRISRAFGGTEAGWLLETLDAGGPNGRSLAEFGIGTNPQATITGEILEDEKVEGTIHLAFGTSAGIGGVVEAGVHIDGLVRRATVELDGRVVMRDGVLLAEAVAPA